MYIILFLVAWAVERVNLSSNIYFHTELYYYGTYNALFCFCLYIVCNQSWQVTVNIDGSAEIAGLENDVCGVSGLTQM